MASSKIWNFASYFESMLQILIKSYNPYKPDTCDWDNKNSEDPNPHTLFGAVVSGPNMIDEFEDDRSDYQHSTVGLTHNAGYLS